MSNTVLIPASFNALKAGFVSSPSVPFEQMGITKVRFEYEVLENPDGHAGAIEHVEPGVVNGALVASINLYPNSTYRVRTVAFSPQHLNGKMSSWYQFSTGVSTDITYRSFYVLQLNESPDEEATLPEGGVPYGYLPILGANIKVTGHDTPHGGLNVETNQHGFAVVGQLEKSKLYLAAVTHEEFEPREVSFTASNIGTTMVILVPIGQVYQGALRVYTQDGSQIDDIMTFTALNQEEVRMIKTNGESWFLKHWSQLPSTWLNVEYSEDATTWVPLQAGSQYTKANNTYIRITCTVANPADYSASFRFETPSNAFTTLGVNFASE